MKLVQYQRPVNREWLAFEPFAALQNEVNRLFNTTGFGSNRNTDVFGGWNPALDVVENAGNFVVTAELPGVKKDEINISFTDGVLTISGERKEEKETNEGETVRSERFFGQFQRAISLKRPVAVDKTTASYKDGVLTVTLPKTEEAKPRQIEVHVQ